jgi:hypothetical protein
MTSSPKLVNVKTTAGKYVHRARKLSTRLGDRYEVVCRRASRWHTYTPTKDPVDCPHCLRREAPSA